MQKLRVVPGFDLLKAGGGPDDYFLLSCIDGNLTLREVLLATGLPVDRGIAIVLRLRSLGALLLPNEASPTPSPDPVAKPRTFAATTPAKAITPPRGLPAGTGQQPRTRAPSRPPLPGPGLEPPTLVHPSPATAAAPPALDLTLPNPSGSELKSLSEPGELSDQTRRKILAIARLLDARDPHALLGVPRDADTRTLKRAYFKLSKDIHPDRYYGKQLGSFAEILPMVFEALARAYERLTNPEKSGTRGSQAVTADQPQTPTEYAAELFERACQIEVGGDALEAMKMFSAAIRIDPQTKYLRRSATCALAAGQPRTALEHAKKAQSNSPSDPSLARLLATAFTAAGKLADAEEVLVMAMALKSENDVLGGELRNDLVAVRKLLAGERQDG